MNLNKQSPAAIGLFLIGLGLVWWLGLWGLLLPAALVIGGAIGYQQRRNMGRTPEGVQIGLWAVGLGLLFLIGFVWPGVLFLAGASILMRGREDRVDAYVQNAIAQVRRARPATRSVPSQRVEISSQYPVPGAPPRTVEHEHVTTGETTRL